MRQQEANLGDFIRSATDRKSLAARSNRFRKLTVDDLNALSTPETASRGGGHLLLTREANPKLAESDDISFPPLTPSVQGEKCGVSTCCFADPSALRPLSMALPSAAQAVETEDFVAAYNDPILCAIMSDHPLSTQDMRDIKDWTVAQQNCVGVGGQRANKKHAQFFRSRTRR